MIIMGFRFAKWSQILIMVSAFGRWVTRGQESWRRFCGWGMLQDHDGAHCLSVAMRKRTVLSLVTCHPCFQT